MDKPEIFEPYPVTTEIDVLPAYFPIPGLGILPINAFLLKAAEPVLVDTGLSIFRDEFIEKLNLLIDLDHLIWLWLTHCDPDHIGSLQQILRQAPKLRVITTFLGAGKMSLFQPLPMDRVCFLNPGQSILVGDRILIAIRPPSYDSPETIAMYDSKSNAFFSADCFGALMSEPAKNAADIRSSDLKEGLQTWATLDSPWLHALDKALFKKTLDCVRDLSPSLILSGHLPPARNMTDELLYCLSAVPEEKPFIGPDQQALEAMLKESTPKITVRIASLGVQ
jgi:flavorubredoxin